LVLFIGLLIISYIANKAITPDPDYNTVYSKKYKEEYFNNKLIGLSETALIQLLGTPLKREYCDFNDTYIYTNSTDSVHFIEGINAYPFARDSINFISINFDRDEIVSDVWADSLISKDELIGKTKQFIIKKFGKPEHFMFCNCECEILSFAYMKEGGYRGKHPVSYIRKVFIDNNKVVKIIKKTGNPFNTHDETCIMK
jgi:hypothetical protein